MKVTGKQLSNLIQEVLINRDVIKSARIKNYVDDLGATGMPEDNFINDYREQLIGDSEENQDIRRLSKKFIDELYEFILAKINKVDMSDDTDVNINIYDIVSDNPDIEEDIIDFVERNNKLYLHKRDAGTKKINTAQITIHGIVAYSNADTKEIIVKQGSQPAISYYTGKSVVIDGIKLKVIDAAPGYSVGYMRSDGTPGYSVLLQDMSGKKYYFYNLEKGDGAVLLDEASAEPSVIALFK